MITKTIVFWATLMIWAPFKTTKLLSCLNPVWHCYIFSSWPLVTLSTNHVKTHIYIHCTQNAFCFFRPISISNFSYKNILCFLATYKNFENTWNLQFLMKKTRYNIYQLVYWWNIKKNDFQRKTVIWVYGWSPSWWPLWERTCLAGGPLRTWNVTRPLSIR